MKPLRLPLLALVPLLALGACSAAERTGETVGDAAETTAEATATAATATGNTIREVGEDAAEAVGLDSEAGEDGGAVGMAAVAEIRPTSADGAQVTGTVRFEQQDDGVLVSIDLRGLTPNASHGFHVHENGSCEAAMVDGKMTPAGAAGGHYNPMDAPHGAPSAEMDSRHVGDLGNITADADGNATATMKDDVIGLSGGHDIVGKALLVHGGTDDLTSQPSGDAGTRIGCGIITMAGN